MEVAYRRLLDLGYRVGPPFPPLAIRPLVEEPIGNPFSSWVAVKLVPIPDDPLAELRAAASDELREASLDDLQEATRDAARDQAGEHVR